MDKAYQHIVLISLDTLRADCFNKSPKAYEFKKQYNVGDIILQTSGLDDLFSKSTYYNECHTVAWYTSASHASYFTWFWPNKHWIYEYFNRKIQKSTIFEYAKKAGYDTIFQTDFPIILGKYLWLNNGVDNYFIENETEALKLLKSKKASKTISFFHFWWIHYPYGFHIKKFWGNEYVQEIDDLEKKYNIRLDVETSDLHDETYRNAEDKNLLKRYKRLIQYMYDHQLYDELFSLYLKGINRFMKNRFHPFLRDIIEFVDQNNGLLVLFSDHWEWWTDSCFGHGNSLDKEIINTILLFYGKNIPHVVKSNLVRAIDIFPTLASIMGISFQQEEFDWEKLDIFWTWTITEDWRYSISQRWRSTNINKYYKFLHKVLKNSRIYKPLKDTYLHKERIMYWDKELYIVYDQDSNILTEEYKIGGKISAPDINRDNLMDILKGYNAENKYTKKEADVSKGELVAYFKDLGYNI